MPTGSPLSLKCPKCRRGQWGHAPRLMGCRPTGSVEARITTTKQQGHGNGGPARTGHRGEAECRDCGHRWYSSHPFSGWKRCYYPSVLLPWCSACVETKNAESEA